MPIGVCYICYCYIVCVFWILGSHDRAVIRFFIALAARTPATATAALRAAAPILAARDTAKHVLAHHGEHVRSRQHAFLLVAAQSRR